MKKERILFIDGWNIVLSCNSVNYHLTNFNSDPINMYLGGLNTVRSFVDKFKPSKVFFVLDGPEAGERRRKLYPNYKGKRRIKERESRVQLMEGDDNLVYGVEGAFQNQLIKIYEFLKLLPISVISIPYCEADDMISYLALKNKEEYENIIISNDRDYLQLIDEGISVYRWKTKIFYDKKRFEEEFKIKPSHFIFKKVLMGDSSDLVEGIKGMGEKTFAEISFELLKEENTFKNIGEFISYFENIDLNKYSTRTKNTLKKALSEDKDKMLLLYRIMKLDESCLYLHHVDILKQQIEEQKDKLFSRFSARIKLQKDQFNKLYSGFNEDKWLQPFAFIKSGVEVIT